MDFKWILMEEEAKTPRFGLDLGPRDPWQPEERARRPLRGFRHHLMVLREAHGGHLPLGSSSEDIDLI